MEKGGEKERSAEGIPAATSPRLSWMAMPAIARVVDDNSPLLMANSDVSVQFAEPPRASILNVARRIHPDGFHPSRPYLPFILNIQSDHLLLYTTNGGHAAVAPSSPTPRGQARGRSSVSVLRRTTRAATAACSPTTGGCGGRILTLDPFAAGEFHLRHVALPEGHGARMDNSDDKHRCVKVSEGKLRYVEIDGFPDTPAVTMTTLIDLDGAVWNMDYRVGLDEIWADDGYKLASRADAGQEMDEHQSGNFKIQDIKDCTAVTSAEAARQFFTAQLEDIRMKKGTRKEKGTRQKNDAAAAKEERAIEVGASSSVEAVAAQVQAAEETKAIPQGLLAHDAKE
ncbi:hypothetical protein OsI_31592 [Oryza sativa Indica Group]|nr:hypothetical protein OsI_31592 [Oryza sativa Indica Group]